MIGKLKAVKTAYMILLLILSVVSFKFLLWDRINNVNALKSELKLQQRLYQAKEAEYMNTEANRAVIEQADRGVSGFTDKNEIVDAALYVGELAQSFELTETGSSYNTNLIQTDNPQSIAAITRIDTGFIGEYANVMKLMQALKNGKFAYYFNSMQFSSAGMRPDYISVKIELLMYSIFPPEDKLPYSGRDNLKKYLEEYKYENPFYYEKE